MIYDTINTIPVVGDVNACVRLREKVLNGDKLSCSEHVFMCMMVNRYPRWWCDYFNVKRSFSRRALELNTGRYGINGIVNDINNLFSSGGHRGN